jgi:hypothetical protein
MEEKTYNILVNDRSVLFTAKIITIKAINQEDALKKAKINYPSCDVTLIKEEK